ncbi:unnamed protein product, partial [Coregonus sp. 'balchen']
MSLRLVDFLKYEVRAVHSSPSRRAPSSSYQLDQKRDPSPETRDAGSGFEVSVQDLPLVTAGQKDPAAGSQGISRPFNIICGIVLSEVHGGAKGIEGITVTAGSAGGTSSGRPEEREGVVSQRKGEGGAPTSEEPESVSLKERMAMYQAAVSKKEAGSSSAAVMEESEACSLPGGLASVKKQFESQEYASSSQSQTSVTHVHLEKRSVQVMEESEACSLPGGLASVKKQFESQEYASSSQSQTSVTHVHLEKRSVQEVSSSQEVTVRSSVREVIPTTQQVAFFHGQEVTHDQRVQQSNVASSYENHYGETVRVIGGEDLPKVSTQALKQQYEKTIEEATPGKQIKIDLDYNQFQWAPVNQSSSAAASYESSSTVKQGCLFIYRCLSLIHYEDSGCLFIYRCHSLIHYEDRGCLFIYRCHSLIHYEDRGCLFIYRCLRLIHYEDRGCLFIYRCHSLIHYEDRGCLFIYRCHSLIHYEDRGCLFLYRCLRLIHGL